MQNILFQWDKACDAMPLLRPASRALSFGLLIFLVFYILPGIYMPENLHRPGPLDYAEYDTEQARYVEGRRPFTSSDNVHNVEPERIKETIESRILTRPQDVEGNVVRQEMTGGIGRQNMASLNEEKAWDFREQVAYIVPIGFEEYQFKIDTGVWIDTRNLHKTGEYRQFVTVKAPPGIAYQDVNHRPFTVTRLRDTKTQCLYYSMHIFGKRRIVLGGDNQKIDVSC